MALIEDTQNGGDGIVAILDLPVGSVFNIDGQSIALKRNDFVGCTSLPSTIPDSGDNKKNPFFHFVTVRAGSPKCQHEQYLPPASAITVGFFVLYDDINNSLIRQYDPHTEEVSAKAVDEGTASSLIRHIREGKLDPQRILSYDQVVSHEKITVWRKLTNYIKPTLLRKRGIQSCQKVIPRVYEDEESEKDISKICTDGKPLDYPPIPVILSPQLSVARSCIRHTGTKRFMTQLTPLERTTLYTNPRPGTAILSKILDSYYSDDNSGRLIHDRVYDDILGDVQLAYITFLNLHCFSSLCHWRDLISMLCAVEKEGIQSHSLLYQNFLRLLENQVQTIDKDFFDDSGLAEGNFLIPSIQTLSSRISEITQELKLIETLSNLRNYLKIHFGGQFDDDHDITEQLFPRNIAGDSREMNCSGDSEEDEDGPVIVAQEEVEASMARISDVTAIPFQVANRSVYSAELKRKYPLLFASMEANATEDILMTCARVLDEKLDVSLVREAAAYLEDVEAKK